MLLFAVGDGNHSLATAKECYERQKRLTPPEHWDALPARFALVELNNLHDSVLEFEPIHRVVFGVEPQQLLEAMEAYYPGFIHGEGEGHVLPYVWGECQGTVTVPNPKAQLPVGTLQRFLDDYLQNNPGRVDYIHGAQVARDLARRKDTIAFLLPAMGKEELFPTVIHDGVLPRKTFSMGRRRINGFTWRPGGSGTERKGAPCMKTRAWAKLNLTLDVLGKREDGYHDLCMVMQSVTLHDTLTLTPNEGQGLRVKTNLRFLPTGDKNLADAAALRFWEALGREPEHLDIEIQKRIPVCAGMAGGSSDAAAVLRALNDLQAAPLLPQSWPKWGRM